MENGTPDPPDFPPPDSMEQNANSEKMNGADSGYAKVPTEDRQQGGVEGKEDVVKEKVIEVEDAGFKRLIYKTGQSPPWHSLLLLSLQQSLLPVSAGLSVTLLVTEVVCARDDTALKTQILSATFFMTGLSTFTMSTFGIRLPIFQGPAATYIIPLFALSSLPEWRCPSQEDLVGYYSNTSSNVTDSFDGVLPVPREFIYDKIRQLSGSLMVAGGLHCLIGLTGLVGFLLKYIGPITIVPSITLVGLYLYKVVLKFSETYWPVAILTAVCGLVLSLYLAKRSTPIPAWNRHRGLHIKWYPLHQVFAILISIIIGWTVSVILTHYDVLSSDRDSVQFYARTDTQTHVITSTPWFSFPYPGQFGFPTFHAGVFLSFFVATLLSVLDSIGDYSACARMCYVPQPPFWAVNRGISVEGLMSMLSGGLGVGHSTVSFGGNIGAIGLTRVASRRVFQVVGLIYVILAILSKVGAVFITVPYSVLGGTQIITTGFFIGIVLSNLQYVDLGSTRNVAIIGISLLFGLMMPYWVGKNPDALNAGTLEERGIGVGEYKLQTEEEDGVKRTDDQFEEGLEVYDLPWLPQSVQRSWIAKVFRIFPGKTAAASKDSDEKLLPHHLDTKDQ
ncbi:hypothetical protein BaRGS_00010347 [Batillaria attramentaria]|uniref:Uncharacterized protein n=1 Tax=Batillaria attramentaria TaxID=370345 RepID=A0ABD0LGZ4_9CAEN